MNYENILNNDNTNNEPVNDNFTECSKEYGDINDVDNVCDTDAIDNKSIIDEHVKCEPKYYGNYTIDKNTTDDNITEKDHCIVNDITNVIDFDVLEDINRTDYEPCIVASNDVFKISDNSVTDRKMEFGKGIIDNTNIYEKNRYGDREDIDIVTSCEIGNGSNCGNEGDLDKNNIIDENHDDKSPLGNNCIFHEVKDFYINNKKCFKIAHINVNSIRHKINPFKEVLNENIFDFLSIQETKLDSSFPDGQFKIPQYKLYRNDYKNNEGGLLFYIRNDMPQHRRYDIEACGMNNAQGRIEILSVEITINKEKWVYISMYKQPKVGIGSLMKCIDEVIVIACLNDNVNVVLLGDVNVNMLESNSLHDCLDIHGLRQIVKDPTCFKGVPSLIDLIITNKHKRLQNCISRDTGLSDFHNMICVSTKFHVPKIQATRIAFRSYRHFNEAEFLADLSMIPFQVAEVFDEIDDSYWLCNQMIMEIVDKHAPIKSKTMKGFHVPYMNGELRRAINVKHMLKRKYDKCNSTENWQKYRKQRNIVTKLRKKSMKTYMQNKCNEATTSGGFWEAVKPLISNKCINKDDNIILKKDGDVVNKPEDICNIFNNYFVNITSEIGYDDTISEDDNCESCVNTHNDHSSIDIINDYSQRNRTNISEFCFLNVDIKTVSKHLHNLKCKKATGCDNLPSKILKIGSSILCYPYAFLLNKCINQSSFPSFLKNADVCPVYKKGDNMDISNYRPVSILPNISKVFEKRNYFPIINSF